MYTVQSKTRRQVIGVKALNNMDIGQLNPVGVSVCVCILGIYKDPNWDSGIVTRQTCGYLG